MSKQKQVVSQKTVEEAEAIARATQQPGQTKEQTKLIAKGIQKGIAEYKKRQKSKARDLDKKLHKVKKLQSSSQPESEEIVEISHSTSFTKLPWILLLLSWGSFFALYWLGLINV